MKYTPLLLLLALGGCALLIGDSNTVTLVIRDVTLSVERAASQPEAFDPELLPVY